jgi:hypothetical protein
MDGHLSIPKAQENDDDAIGRRLLHIQNSTKDVVLLLRATSLKFLPTRTLTASASQSSGISSEL